MRLHIRLVLKAPNTPLLTMLADRAGIMVSPKLRRRRRAPNFGSKPVCAGPYHVREPGGAGQHRPDAVPGLLGCGATTISIG